MIATDMQLLLKACRDNPAEDTPRLVLADEVQACGFDGAAAFIRDDLELHTDPNWSSRPPRTRIGRNYGRWLMSLFGLPAESDCIFGGKSWNEYIWQDGNNRHCKLQVERGLPMHLTTSAPMLMERAALQFLFPLTSVTIVGRKPWRDDIGGVNYGWTCTSYPQKWNTWEEYDHEIPVSIWRRLAPAGTYARHWNRGHYTRVKDALDDLNGAALAFGRSAVA